MATKPAVKTYSKTYSKDTAASKAFDDALKPNSSKSASQTKWGKTSFSRVREDDPFEVTCKKVKIETESTDPFSFDFEDDGSSTYYISTKKIYNNFHYHLEYLLLRLYLGPGVVDEKILKTKSAIEVTF
jgi:hypothetical protein